MNRIKIALMGSFDGEGRVCVLPDYLNALWAHGAIGTLLPYCTGDDFLRETVDYFDGFLFCGGDDINPTLYGEENKGESKNICSVRDDFEVAIMAKILASGKPILAICRGHQLLNAYLGGTLYQHIDNHLQSAPKNVHEQPIIITKDSLLHNIVGKTDALANSFHHQCIKTLGHGLSIDAKSLDGYIESVHLDEHRFCLGVQWHPEAYFKDDDNSAKIFSAFVEACK